MGEPIKPGEHVGLYIDGTLIYTARLKPAVLYLINIFPP